MTIEQRPIEGSHNIRLPQIQDLVDRGPVAIAIHPVAQDLDRVIPLLTSASDGSRRHSRALARMALPKPVPHTMHSPVNIQSTLTSAFECMRSANGEER